MLTMRITLPSSISYLAVTIIGILLTLIFYILLLRTTQGLSGEDVAWVRSILKDTKPDSSIRNV